MTPTSLKESTARVVKTYGISYGPKILPRTLIEYLGSANCCVNPNCKGEKLISVLLLIKIKKKNCCMETLSCLTQIVIIAMNQHKIFCFSHLNLNLFCVNFISWMSFRISEMLKDFQLREPFKRKLKINWN